jgi:hypothetical protein
LEGRCLKREAYIYGNSRNDVLHFLLLMINEFVMI